MSETLCKPNPDLEAVICQILLPLTPSSPSTIPAHEICCRRPRSRGAGPLESISTSSASLNPSRQGTPSCSSPQRPDVPRRPCRRLLRSPFLPHRYTVSSCCLHSPIFNLLLGGMSNLRLGGMSRLEWPFTAIGSTAILVV